MLLPEPDSYRSPRMRRKVNPESLQSEIELDLYESPSKPPASSRKILRPQKARSLEEEVLLVGDDEKADDEVINKQYC